MSRLAANAAIPSWADGPGLSSITRTPEELSIVGPESRVPAGTRSEGGWRAFQLVGPVPFATTGVIAGLAEPIAEIGVGIFVLSTFDTDYLLVKQANLQRAVAAWRQAGQPVEG